MQGIDQDGVRVLVALILGAPQSNKERGSLDRKESKTMRMRTWC